MMNEQVSNSYKLGKCIACGNPTQDLTQEHFVAATASEGVSPPEDSNPQRVEAPQDYAGSATSRWRESASKGRSPGRTGMPAPTVSTEMVDRIADCLIEDHIVLMNEVERLRQVCRNAYEVWAGSEGIPKPETAAEAYLYSLVCQMRDEVKKGL